MTDWADEKARGLCPLQPHAWPVRVPTSCGYCDGIAAALRDAREQGAREERRACWQLCMERATHRPSGDSTKRSEYEAARDIALAVKGRGPMSEGGEAS